MLYLSRNCGRYMKNNYMFDRNRSYALMNRNGYLEKKGEGGTIWIKRKY